jgi:hypothetical protein
MKQSIHNVQTIMAHPHSLPSFPAREEGNFFMNTTGTGLVATEGGANQYQLSKNEHGPGILEPDHCFISLSLQGGDNV